MIGVLNMDLYRGSDSKLKLVHAMSTDMPKFLAIPYRNTRTEKQPFLSF